MRICHVITRLILGGAQENTLLTCEGLHARGHEVTLATGPAVGPEGDLMDRARGGGYRVEVIDELCRDIRPFRDRAAGARLRRLLADAAPDVMHSHSSKAGILARKAAADVGGMKIVHTIHGSPFHAHQAGWKNRLYAALERRAARRTDAILSVAEAMTRQYLAAGVGRPEQYATVYSGMEVDRFLVRPPEADDFRASLNLPPGAVLVTQVSRIAELKGHAYLLEAARHVRPEVHFCFVGDGALRPAIQRRIDRSGLAGRFRLTGLLSPERIPAAMHASDLVAHCSLREGLARALPQAMLAGRPVVSFDVDGAREVVDETTGALVPAGAIGPLAGAIDRLAGDAELRTRLGAAGRARCREQFDHERMVDRIEAIYRRIGAGG